MDATALARELIDKHAHELRARWPEAPPVDDVLRHLAEHIAAQRDIEAVLPRLRVADLFLAWWAGTGDPCGIAAFEAEHATDLRRLVQRFHRLPAEDLRQQLRLKLFVGTLDRPPRIHTFTGFGFLQNWLRVTAARTFVDIARTMQAERFEDDLDEHELALAHPGADPRDHQQSAQLTAAIKHAFVAAIAALPQRERTFLRMASIDRLSLDEIAGLFKVHRATVARTLASARERLRELTRSGVATELGISPDDLASAVRVLESGIDLSLARVLRDAT